MNAPLDRFLARLRALVSRSSLDQEFDAELAHHFEMLVEEKIKSGFSPDEARRQAHITLGGNQQLREINRSTRSLPWVEQFVQDFWHACRIFRKERGFTTVALLILAIGIGLNTTVFSLVNTVLLRPIPFAQSDRLIWVTNGNPGGSRLDLSDVTSRIDTWEGLEAANRTLEKLEGYNPFSLGQTFRLTGNGDPETITPIEVSSGLFDLLGMKPILGRLFLPEDALKNAPFRTLLSNQLWRRRFNADPKIVGQTVQINGAAVEVIGVLPPADPFTSVFFPAVRIDLFSALRKDNERTWGNVVALIGRMKPGVTVDAARADLALAATLVKQKYPDDGYFSANVAPLHEWVSGNLKRPLFFLWLAAGTVLAIVSFNLGGLFLARGAVRRKELALRSALGASHGRIVRQLLTECLTLTIFGALLGMVLSWGFIHFLSIRSAVEIPLLQNVRLDLPALGFTVLLCLIAVVLCGAMPAWKMTLAEEILTPLREDGRSSSAGRQQSRSRSGLVVLEIALACTLAISAGLIVRSFINLLKTDLGFTAKNLIAIRIDPVVNGSQINYLDSLLDRVRATPGIEQAALTDCIPVERDRSWGVYPVIPDAPKDQRWAGAHVRIVSSKLFATMGTTVIAGRDFTDGDRENQPIVMILNHTLAMHFWPDGKAVGRQVIVNSQPVQVVGVVGDVRHDGPEFPCGNEMYFSVRQVQDASSWDMLVRTTLPVSLLTANLHQALRDFDPTLPLTKVRTLESLMDRTLSSRKMLVSLITGFAAIAVALAIIGLYGVISYMVTQQTKEIGIRMALGANASIVQRQVVGTTLKLTATGLALGLVLAQLATRSFQSILYGVPALDALTYVITVFALLLCALIAGYIPARRASRVDPLISLRAE